jgi:Zn-finger protein
LEVVHEEDAAELLLDELMEVDEEPVDGRGRPR